MDSFLNAWNSKLKLTSPVILTTRRKRNLSKIVTTYFQNDLTKWKGFLDKILSSKFLMGEVTNFKATFDWVLRESSVLKILEGNYLGKDEIVSAAFQEQKVDVISDLKNNSEYDPRWKGVMLDLVKQFGEGTYKSWLSKMYFDSFRKGILTLKVDLPFTKYWIETYYSRKLLYITKNYFEGIEKVCLFISEPAMKEKENL